MNECMSRDEIGHWVRELTCREDWGWSGTPLLIARELGFWSTAALLEYAEGRKNINLKRQRRASDQLFRILAGELVVRRHLVRTTHFSEVHSEVVPAEHPVPLAVLRPLQCLVRATPFGVKLSVKSTGRAGPAPTMPSFSTVWERLNGRPAT